MKYHYNYNSYAFLITLANFDYCRKTLWDVPPPGYEDITPVKYKALRGMKMLFELNLQNFYYCPKSSLFSCMLSQRNTVMLMKIPSFLFILYHLFILWLC